MKYISEKNRRMSERLCGCHAVTGAGVVTSLQLILLVLTLSSTGMVLARYRVWESYEPRGALNATEIAAAEKDVTARKNPEDGTRSMVESDSRISHGMFVQSRPRTTYNDGAY
ncbi:hypothetical protein NECAME_12307 [Necator americanus]|uniref:Uncharacterized protein n=1 Tax=Necator americanus TaxID=51031 RepID=W2T2W0_NECAM|nr:hypothetical protein NECAME_12307 [Necator americanus]ETN75576.1 hypothetical protein NECAME_12307 [Necator americanus]